MSLFKTYKGKLGQVRAKHLLRRSTFIYNIETIQEFSNLTADQALNKLFEFEGSYKSEPLDPITKEPYINLYRGKPFVRRRNNGSKIGRLLKYNVGWWMKEALGDQTMQSKLVFFLHTCFSVNYGESKGIFPNHFYDYIQLLATYSSKSYKRLAFEMVIDNTMLEYLDNYTNSKDNPNENFAREFLELFTIGKGEQIGDGNYSTYTEQDVITAAKLLTGFVKGPRRIDSSAESKNIVIKNTPCRGSVNFSLHDTTAKVFSSSFSNYRIEGAVSKKDMWRELNDFVDMIFSQRSTALNITRKIYRFFVHRNISPDVEQSIISPLADILLENNYSLVPVIRTLLISEHFLGASVQSNAPSFVGSSIKSPLDLTLATLSFYKVGIPDATKECNLYYEAWFKLGMLEQVFLKSGFNPFAPQDVAGYPSYYQSPNFDRGWFSSSSIIGRYSFIEKLTKDKSEEMDFGGVTLDMVSFVKDNIRVAEDADILIHILTSYFFPLPLTLDRKSYFLQVLLDDMSLMNWKIEWNKYVESNDDSIIKRSLNRLVVSLVNAPEFQLL